MKEKTKTAYRHLYFAGENGELEHVVTSSVTSNGHGDFQSTVLNVLEDMDRVIKGDDEGKAGLWVNRKLWKSTKDRMSTEELEIQFARKPGLPILLSAKPLRRTVVKIVKGAGFAYWDDVSSELYWDPEFGEPDNWGEEWELPESPDVNTEIEMSDVQIGKDYLVYKDIDVFLKRKFDELERPELEEEEDEEEDEGTKEEPPEEEYWDTEKGPGIASAVLKDVRRYPLSEDAGTLTNLIIKVTGGKKFNHLEHLVKRTSLKNYNLNLQAKVEASVEDGLASEIKVQVNGEVDALDSVGVNTLQRILEKFDQVHSVAVVEAEFDTPVKIDEEEDNILSELANDLEGTNLNLSVKAEGKMNEE